MRIAIWQPRAGVRDAAAALAALAEAATHAAHAGSDLLLGPELLLPGSRDPATLAAFAEPSDGGFARGVAAIARRTGIAIAAGYVEAAFGHLFSAALLVDARGIAVAHYRRVHLLPAETAILSPGQWTTLAPVDGRRVGVLLGSDLLMPEAARVLALARASLLLVAGAPPGIAAPRVRALARVRALENALPLALAAFAEPEGMPCGGLFAADGTDVALAAGELTLGELPAAVEPAVVLPARRPDLYRILCAETTPVGSGEMP